MTVLEHTLLLSDRSLVPTYTTDRTFSLCLYHDYMKIIHLPLPNKRVDANNSN